LKVPGMQIVPLTAPPKDKQIPPASSGTAR
jgi:hypothetical protein